MILKILSRLIDYPNGALNAHQEELLAEVAAQEGFDNEFKTALSAFIERRLTMDLLDWQAEYDGLFERGRSLSLLLFEHVHGESRDRGQAMVELMEQYKAAGLNISVRELPDYIPLYLEFVATQPVQEQAHWLADVAHILALLAARLKKRDNDYHLVFLALLKLAQADVSIDDVLAQIDNEKRDDSREAIDKVWEEEAVSFGGDAVNGGCPTNQHKPSSLQDRSSELPINFVDAAASGAQSKSVGSPL
ncbi:MULTISPECIES: nitrate reductase molybdenum cofactor assembly chaperone [unclassified Pseudoalteromonas]|uniref:nitrate reductase molybdenum cofactor assembly chaperone n=1 Tax=unclassified Pseudoalteromonas TaxID=194690 RepID=UPI000CF6CE74|nr:MULTISPECIES: nitrate reductase molybdenum cofactor assembly chaperone [unclassified Pseudoalteromonas]MBS3798049.1 nitrate reductase molybdenum cofactor assembly chaperone [Pseudoalteromonas sp. BDTF-M6]